MRQEGISMAFRSPGQYIQGAGEFKRIFSYSEKFGNRIYILIDSFFYKQLSRELKENIFPEQFVLITEEFKGEATEKKVKLAAEQIEKHKIQVIIGIGGGKTLDTVKAIAHITSRSLIVVPTSASTDAPCSALSIIYSEDSASREVLKCKNNPNIVLVDSDIIAKAPLRFLVAGMGDAMATYFEARANYESGGINFIPDRFKSTNLGMNIAKLCYDILINDGVKALVSVKLGVRSRALENVIEANILLSGLGFENTGCAGAHSVSAGLAAAKECESCLHGEKVAFGTLCQLFIENRPISEMDAVYSFYSDIGLPITLGDLGIKDVTRDIVRRIAKKSMKGTFWSAEPFYVSEEDVYGCIMAADEYGQLYKEKNYVMKFEDCLDKSERR